MTDAEIVRLVQESGDESRALSLAILELFSEKLLPGSWQTFLSKGDAEKLLKKQEKIMERFKRERAERARALVLPPGARS